MADSKEIMHSHDAEVAAEVDAAADSTRSSAEDEKDMYRLGKQQEFKRNFRFVGSRFDSADGS